MNAVSVPETETKVERKPEQAETCDLGRFGARDCGPTEAMLEGKVDLLLQASTAACSELEEVNFRSVKDTTSALVIGLETLENTYRATGTMILWLPKL